MCDVDVMKQVDGDEPCTAAFPRPAPPRTLENLPLWRFLQTCGLKFRGYRLGLKKKGMEALVENRNWLPLPLSGPFGNQPLSCRMMNLFSIEGGNVTGPTRRWQSE